MKRLVILSSACAIIAGTLFSFPVSARPDRECRREVVKLCGMDRGKIRQCIRSRSDELSENCRTQIQKMAADRMQRNDASVPVSQDAQTVSFGANARQKIDFYKPATLTDPPLVLFIHGGGWQIGDRSRVQLKPAFFNGEGYAFASTGYRLVPDATVEEQAQDIAAAIAKLRSRSDTLGFNSDRIIIIGHSAGAHLAALVATDPAYLGTNMEAIKGVILLDGAGYDVARRMENAKGASSAIYQTAFGMDAARQARLSPASHTAVPNANNWMILHVSGRADSKAQSESFGSKLSTAGANVTIHSVPDTDHGRLNRELGQSENAATDMVRQFLAELSE